MKTIISAIFTFALIITFLGCDKNDGDAPNGWLENSLRVEGVCDWDWNSSAGDEFFSMRNNDTTFVTVLLDEVEGSCRLNVGYGGMFGWEKSLAASSPYVTSATFAITDSGIVNFSWWCSSLDSFVTSCAGKIKLLRRNKFDDKIFWGKQDSLLLISFRTGQGNCTEYKYFHFHKNSSGSTQKIIVYMRNYGDCTFKVWGDSTYPRLPMDTLKLLPAGPPNEKWTEYNVAAGTSMRFYAGCTYPDSANTNFCAGLVRLYLID